LKRIGSNDPLTADSWLAFFTSGALQAFQSRRLRRDIELGGPEGEQEGGAVEFDAPIEKIIDGTGQRVRNQLMIEIGDEH
jgi:hypothetical protein